MKSLVIKPFIDKETQIGYIKGDTYESNDSKRIAFLVGEGFLKETPRKRQVKKDAE